MADKTTALEVSEAALVPEIRDDSGRFVKGTSGNPGGRSAERERLRRYVLTLGQEAIDGIYQLAKNAENEKVRLDAQTWIAEQCIGKAVVSITGEDGGPVQVDLGIIAVLRKLAGESQ